MTQEERWNFRNEEVKAFVESNKRNLSKFAPEERQMIHLYAQTSRRRLSLFWGVWRFSLHFCFFSCVLFGGKENFRIFANG